MENNKARYPLVHDNTDSVIKETFAENDRIKFWVHFVLLKDGKDGHRIRSR